MRKLAANRRNLAQRKGLTEDGRRRLRAAALRDKPWLCSGGPQSVAGKSRSRMNAVRHGDRSARHRMIEAYLISIGRLWKMESFCDAYDLTGGNLEISTFCRYSATFGDYMITARQVAHVPPQGGDTTACTAWLREHAQLAEEPVKYGCFPFIELARALNPKRLSAAVNFKNCLWFDWLANQNSS